MAEVKYEWFVPNTPLFNLPKGIKLINDMIAGSIDRMTSVVQTNVKFSAPVGATTQLRNSIKTQRLGNTGTVFSDVFYARFVEYGRSAGRMPPIAPIAQWLQRSTKGRDFLNKLFAAGKLKGSTRQMLIQAAYIKARAIGRRGTKPNPFFERGIKRSEKVLRTEPAILLEKLKRGFGGE